MPFNKILSFVEETIGLSHSSVGEDVIKRVVKARMEHCKLPTLSGYLRKIKFSDDERQEFINEITIPETWFFRDHQPFKLLADYVSSIARTMPERRLKILSIPCSTGEEPYSIAMVLIESGLPKESFVIDAVDVSTRQLQIAKQGVYGENSFRGNDVSFREKYFDKSNGRYLISNQVKSSVVFHHQNILSEKFMVGRGPYNVVFCRNLLIYFSLETKSRVMEVLHRLMVDEGMLFLGHAETGRMTQGLFESVKHPGAFAYFKANVSHKSMVSGINNTSSEIISMPNYSNIRQLPDVETPIDCDHPNVYRSSALVTDVGENELDVAQSLADRGELSLALEQCQKYIAEHPESAEGYCLKGIIELAVDDDQDAVDSFRKALYLQPNHYQSLVHLSVLAEEQGNISAAENYRARADRVSRL